MAEALFSSAEAALGRVVRVGVESFRVIGVVSKVKRFGVGLRLRLERLRAGPHQPAHRGDQGALIIVTNGTEHNEMAKRVAFALLSDRHRGVDDFQVFDVGAMTEKFYAVFRIMQIIVAFIASIALLVGGVGVMNILLVSVSERVREIGLRKAIGASDVAIGAQFLFESALLSALGGLVGVARRALAAQVIGHDHPLERGDLGAGALGRGHGGGDLRLGPHRGVLRAAAGAQGQPADRGGLPARGGVNHVLARDLAGRGRFVPGQPHALRAHPDRRDDRLVLAGAAVGAAGGRPGGAGDGLAPGRGGGPDRGVERDPPRKVRDRNRTTRQLDGGDVTNLDESALLADARVVGQRRRWAMVYWKRNKKQVALVGTRPDALDLYHLRLQRGRFFSEQDVQERRPVAVVGHKVWTDLLESGRVAGRPVDQRREPALRR